MKLIRKENGEYHLLINDVIKSLQEFNITKEDCNILTLGYSVEKMASKLKVKKSSIVGTWEEYDKTYSQGFILGFNAHKELVKDKLFTIEDMRRAMIKCTIKNWKNYSLVETKDFAENYIQSLLPKTEWDVEFDKQSKLKLV